MRVAQNGGTVGGSVGLSEWKAARSAKSCGDTSPSSCGSRAVNNSNSNFIK